MLDQLISLVSPRAGYERAAYRLGLDALKNERSYASGDRGRLARDMRADRGSADSAVLGDMALTRARQRRAVRSNPLLAAIKRNLIVGLVGDGITVRAIHADPVVRARAQQRWDAFCARQVCGRDDFYGVERQAVSGAIDGDCLLVWGPLNGKPDQTVTVIPGDQLDHTLTQALTNGGKIVMGVEFDKAGQRVAYHVFPDHPSDPAARNAGQRVRLDARDVDHVYEILEPGQTRGMPWFHAGLPTAHDIEETKRAIRVKKRIEACLVLFRRPGDGDALALGERKKDGAGPEQEQLRPGMIMTGRPGEEEPKVITPSQSGDGDGFLRAESMSVCAAIGVPYHFGTGDYSQSNYTSMRSDTMAYHARLDDWTYHQLEPSFLGPAFRRQMRLAVLEGDVAMAEVRYEVLPPPRPLVDPLKDIMAKVIEARAIPGALARLLNSYGLDLEEAMKTQAEINKLIDANGLALDTDPRRVNGSGSLQAATGYLAPKGENELAELLTRALPHIVG